MFTLNDPSIRRILAPYGVDASDTLCSQIRSYSELLLRWNESIALTTVTDPIEIVRFHFGESLFAASLLAPLAGRLVDLGSGAGFPGLALKLIAPELSVELVESNLKKATFLSEATRTLDLKDVHVHRMRFEELPVDHRRFEFITARALGLHESILEWSVLMLGATGRLALWLSGEDAAKLSKSAQWIWQAPRLIPATKERYVLVGNPSI